MSLARITNFFVLVCIKIVAHVFYRVEQKWLYEYDGDPWADVKLIVFLNHTSLYEPLFLGAAPWSVLWRYAGKMIGPAADSTMKRPIAGTFYRFILPQIVPISRERDETWDYFMERIKDDVLVLILPEGRMMRANGLDKRGKPMTVRGGVADVLEMMPDENMIIVYSGGLHHVQVPGQLIPNIFKKIKINCERMSISDYVSEIKSSDEPNFKKAVVRDLEARLKRHKPQ